MCDNAASQNMLFNAAQDEWWAAQEKLRPSFLYKPRLFVDGNQWCALYGENLQDGLAGFGASPDAAYRNFDAAWYEKLKVTEPIEDPPDGR